MKEEEIPLIHIHFGKLCKVPGEVNSKVGSERKTFTTIGDRIVHGTCWALVNETCQSS